MVVTDKSNNNPMIAIEAVIPKSIAITNSVKIYNVVQYESYNLSYGVYNPKNLEYVPVEIYLDGELSTSVNAPNNKELTYSFTSNSYGSKLVSFKIGEYVKTVTIEVEETTMDLQEINNNLLLTLSAAGRTNQDANCKASRRISDAGELLGGNRWLTLRAASAPTSTPRQPWRCFSRWTPKAMRTCAATNANTITARPAGAV